MMRWLAALFALTLVGSACSADDGASTEDRPDRTTTTTAASESASSDDPVFPGEDWTVADPADHGIDHAGLEAARAYAFEPEHHTQGVVVIRGGEIVGEWYAEGADAESWAASWSVAKSFTSATTGIAIDEGAIAGVDEPAATYLTDWAGTEHDAITVEDLLQMNSGIDWNEDYRGADAEIVRMVTGEPDQLAYAMSVPQGVEPGTRWSYSSGDTMLLGGVVEAATGQPLDEYAQEHLLDPIGIDQVEWWRDAEGQTLGYCCLDTTSRDFARLGLLYLHDGRWEDEQVVPADWVEATIDPVANSDGQYGYQWWTYDIDGVPAETFLAEGIDGQFIYVIPSLDLVVVRNGTYVKDPGPPVADPNLFTVYPSGGLVEGKGTSEPEDWDSSAFLTPIVEAIDG
jgi:CubicO group peptidase (beta-lactamase class C family)